MSFGGRTIATSRPERRLAAILAADVVGYSRLIEQDEAATLAAIRELRRDVIDPLLTEHHGRMVKLMGDGAVVEFASVVDAVACAVEVQKTLAKQQAQVAPERRLLFRIGINLGDVVVEGDDLLGDGVNIAARLEQLCDPGGVLISGTAYDHLKGKLDCTFASLGERQLKNIERPVRAYAVVPDGAAGPPAPAAPSPPEKPSIAVLPFENLSRDPDQDYFSEGVAEDLITDLSKISGLSVAARQASFAARWACRDALEAGARLRVGYVLEGSVRRTGDRLRITARLVDGASGGQVWAERYDRTLTDIFVVQDDITRSIVRALEVTLLRGEHEALARSPTGNVEAYNLYLRGLQLLGQDTKSSYERARRVFRHAVALDPTFARALAGIAECDYKLYLHCGAAVSMAEVLGLAERAAALEPDLASAHAARGVALLATGRLLEAERAFERAITADPSHAPAHYAYGRACVQQGRREESARLFRRAADLAPDQISYLNMLMMMQIGLGRADEAEATARESLARCERALARQPDFSLASCVGAGALAILGERERALEWAARALSIEPDDYICLYNVACVYARLGSPDKALDLLERAMPGASAYRQAWMRHDPDMDSLRDHPRFVALLRALGTEPPPR